MQGNSQATESDNERVRDHLANERTFLAWLRTGIATMGLGIVLAKLRYLFPAGAVGPPSRGLIHASNIGLLFSVIGLLSVLASAWRYLAVQAQIRSQRYRSSNALILGYAAVVAALGIAILWYLTEPKPSVAK